MYLECMIYVFDKKKFLKVCMDFILCIFMYIDLVNY